MIFRFGHKLESGDFVGMLENESGEYEKTVW